MSIQRAGKVQACVTFLMLLALALARSAPAMAQQISGVPGAPSATMTIQGNQLPAPPLKFGGKIARNAMQSKPWWRNRSRALPFRFSVGRLLRAL